MKYLHEQLNPPWIIRYYNRIWIFNQDLFIMGIFMIVIMPLVVPFLVYRFLKMLEIIDYLKQRVTGWGRTILCIINVVIYSYSMYAVLLIDDNSPCQRHFSQHKAKALNDLVLLAIDQLHAIKIRLNSKRYRSPSYVLICVRLCLICTKVVWIQYTIHHIRTPDFSRAHRVVWRWPKGCST